MTITFAGDVCLDINVVRGAARHEIGGGVYHGALTATRLGAACRVLTKARAADRPRFAAFEQAGVPVSWLPSASGTSIRNDYPSDDPDERVSRVISQAEPFTAADLEGLRTEVLHVNPLWMGMFPPELLPRARRCTRLLGADAQGFLRRVDADGTAAHRPWPEAARWLPLLDLLKVDIVEARSLTGCVQPLDAARALRQLGVGTVLLTHQDGVLAMDARDHCARDWSGWTLEGRTGRGDTCTAAFLVGLERGLSLAAAVALAVRVTSAKMQYRGPYRGG